MSKFGYLSALNVNKDRTADYPLEVLEGCPKLKIRSAGESNKGYFNAVLRRTGTKGARKVAMAKLDSRKVDQNRQEDRELYAEHILIGWEGIMDSDGQPVEFTKENAFDFLTELPDWIFDDLRMFASDISNFIDPLESEDSAKN